MKLLLLALLLPALQEPIVVAVPDADAVAFVFGKEFRVMKVAPGSTLKISAGGPKDISILITLIPDKESKFQTEDDVRKATVQALQSMVTHSVEKRMDLKSFDNRDVRGFYSSFTDESLVGKPVTDGKYLKVTSGLFSLGKTAATFTILYNDSGEAFHKSALLSMTRVRLN